MSVDKNGGRICSYYEAPKIAMDMVEHLPPQQFFNEIPKGSGKYVLTWEGVRILMGLMHVSIESIKHEDSSDVLEVECVAVNKEEEKGFSFISQTYLKKERGKEEDDEDYREKAFSRAKRNAARDLVPDQVFCGLLVEKWKGNNAPKNQQQQTLPPNAIPDAKMLELIEHRQRARTVASYEKEYLQDLHGLTIDDVIAQAEKALDKTQKEWNEAGHWSYLADCLQKPVEMGLEVKKKSGPEKGYSESEAEMLDAEEETTTETAEDAEENPDADLQQVMADIGG